jgi:putative transposase
MNDIQCLSHTKWECKYHVVRIPKYRRKMLYGQLRKNLGEVFHELARQKESKVLEGHLQPDHVHMLISIPPKYSVAQVVGYMKGKSAIHIVRTYLGQRKNYRGMHFWAREYFVTTVGADEEVVPVYINEQEKEDNRVQQMSLFK